MAGSLCVEVRHRFKILGIYLRGTHLTLPVQVIGISTTPDHMDYRTNHSHVNDNPLMALSYHQTRTDSAPLE